MSRTDSTEHDSEIDNAFATLGAVLFRALCPDALTLGEYQQGLLLKAEMATLKAHLADCPYCARELAITHRFMAEAASVGAAQAVQSGLPWYVKAAQLLGSLDQTKPALAVRGSIDEPLIYISDGVQLAFTISLVDRDDSLRRLIGIVAGDTFTTADFWKDGTLVASVRVEESGGLMVDQIAAGTYDVMMRSANFAVEVSALVIP